MVQVELIFVKHKPNNELDDNGLYLSSNRYIYWDTYYARPSQTFEASQLILPTGYAINTHLNSNTQTNSYTCNSGYSFISGAPNGYYKHFNCCVVFGKISVDSPSSDVLFTLPSKYRPSGQINTVGWSNITYGSNSYYLLISIESDGRFRLRSPSGNILSNCQASFSIIFPVV